MSLLSTARAQDDQEFRWRVSAACLRFATGFAGMASGVEQNYAVHTLLNPQSVDPSMVALVATWAPVNDKITVENGTVNTRAVEDGDIEDAVGESWGLVSHKYPTNPLEREG